MSESRNFLKEFIPFGDLIVGAYGVFACQPQAGNWVIGI